MRRRLAIVGICAAAVFSIALGFLLFAGSPVAEPVVFGVALGIAVLAFGIGLLAGVFAILLPLFGSPASFLRRDSLVRQEAPPWS